MKLSDKIQANGILKESEALNKLSSAIYNSSLNEKTSTEEYWDATEIARNGFMSLMKFNFGTDAHGNNYIITGDADEKTRFRATSDENAIKIYDKFRENYRNSDHLPIDMNVDSIVPRDESEELANNDDEFNYRLLSRMKSDCDYYLGNGNGHDKYLWAGNVKDQIKYMRKLYNSFPEDKKPEWISMEDIDSYEKEMTNNEDIDEATLTEKINKDNIEVNKIIANPNNEENQDKISKMGYEIEKAFDGRVGAIKNPKTGREIYQFGHLRVEKRRS